MSSRVKRTTMLAALAVLTLALIGSGVAHADPAADQYNLAVQLKREGKIPEAIASCQKALSLRSNYAAAHRTLSSLYRAQGNYKQAVVELEATLKIEPRTKPRWTECSASSLVLLGPALTV